ncbi:MAG: hypothetical protein AAF645_28655 [Myxococcota bacterium]
MPKDPIQRATDGRLRLASADRDEVIRVAEKSAEADKPFQRFTLLLIAVVIALGIGGGFALVSLLQSSGVPRAASIAVPGVVLPVAIIAGFFLLVSGAERRHIRIALRTCGHDVCSRFGYTLIGIEPESDTDDAKTRCPECGTPNDPLAPHPDAGDAAPGAPNS